MNVCVCVCKRCLYGWAAYERAHTNGGESGACVLVCEHADGRVVLVPNVEWIQLLEYVNCTQPEYGKCQTERFWIEMAVVNEWKGHWYVERVIDVRGLLMQQREDIEIKTERIGFLCLAINIISIYFSKMRSSTNDVIDSKAHISVLFYLQVRPANIAVESITS